MANMDADDNKKKQQRTFTSAMWFASYRNHIVHCSIYVGCLAYLLPRSLLQSAAEFGDDESTSVGNNHDDTTLVASAVSATASLSLTSQVLYSLLVLLVVWLIKGEVRYMILRRNMPPGDSGWPVLGHIWELLVGDPDEFATRLIQQYGSPCTRNILMQPNLFTTTDEECLWFNTQERKGYLVPFTIPQMNMIFGEESILLQHGKAHRRLRRIMEPAFAPTAIKDYAKVMDETVQTELEKLYHRNSNRTSEDVQDEFCCCADDWALIALRIFFVAAFGEVSEDLLQRLTVLFGDWFNGLLSPIPLAIPGTNLALSMRAKRKLGDIMMEQVHKFKDQFPADSDHAQHSLMGRFCYSVDEDGKPLSKEQLITNIMLIVFAGHDTTKSSFSSMIYQLSKRPQLLQWLLEENDEIIQKTKNDGTLDPDLLRNEAPVMNAFLAELWRVMTPTGGHGSTVVGKDLQYKQWTIPRGAGASFQTRSAMVQNDTVYPQSDTFDIRRWLPSDHPLYDAEVANRKRIDYNTMSVQYRAFSVGPHMCLGSHFVKMEARIVLTRLLQHYQFHVKPEDKPRLTMVPMMYYDCNFKLTKRQ